jgi:glycine cleavage system H protein
MDTPKELRYARTHEWVRQEGKLVYVGITDYAQDALGDIVYVELPEKGESFERDQEVGTIESVKAASAIYAPVGGTVVETNPELERKPELINQRPYQAFIFALRPAEAAQLAELLDAVAYEKLVQEEKSKQ